MIVSRETAPTGGTTSMTLPAAPRVHLEVNSGTCSPGRATLAHRPGCVRVLQRMCPEGSETPRTPSSLPSNHHVNTVRRHKECFKPGLQCGRKAARAAGGRSGVAYDVREHCPAPPLQASRRTWLGGPLRLGCIPGAQEHAAMRPVCNVRLATWRPVRINPQCELMPPAPPATPLPVWDTPQAMRRLQT